MTSKLKNFTLEIVKISIRGPIYLIPSVVRSFPYSHYQMNLLYLMVNINEKIILGSLTKEEWGKNIRQITMPLRQKKKFLTFAIEWEIIIEQ